MSASSEPSLRRHILTALLGPLDGLWTGAEAGSASDHGAFESHAQRLTSVHLQLTTLVITAISVVALPSDFFVFAGAPEELRTILVWRAAILAVCVTVWAVLRFRLVPFPVTVGMLGYAGVMGASGVLMARVGGLDHPLFYGIYTAPLMTVVLVVGPWRRALAVAVVILSYLVCFFAVAPEQLDMPGIGVPFVWLAASSVTAVVAGQVATWLLRVNYVQRRALHRRSRALDELTDQLEARVAAQTSELRELATNLSGVQEAERLHLARELHDELGQVLTGLQMELDWLERATAPKGKPRAALADGVQRSQRLLDSVNDSLDRVVLALRPTVLDRRGLSAALDKVAREFQGRVGIPCELSFQVDEERLDEPRTIAIYRIVQEALTNVARHARAKSVCIDVDRQGGDCIVSIRDDGVGFELDAARPDGHFGLLGIRERARTVGGSSSLESEPGRGTTVRASLPLEPTDPAAVPPLSGSNEDGALVGAAQE